MELKHIGLPVTRPSLDYFNKKEMMLEAFNKKRNDALDHRPFLQLDRKLQGRAFLGPNDVQTQECRPTCHINNTFPLGNHINI